MIQAQLRTGQFSLKVLETPAEKAIDAIELSIVMPCLNEAETLAVCVRNATAFLAEHNIAGEVIIADNGSTDGSQQIATSLGARLVNVPARGYGAALLGGIEAAQGRFVAMGDADDSYDFGSLMPFVAELRRGADLVMGNRFKGGIASGAMPLLHRYLVNPVLSFVGRAFFGTPVGDFHCGLRAFRRDSLLGLGLSSPGMEFASEMVVKASIARLDIREVPTTLRPDGRSRPPHLRTWRDGWRHLRFLMLHSPRWTFAYPGLAILALGLLTVMLLITGQLEIGGVGFDIRTFLLGCLGISVGFQTITFAFLARRFAGRSALLPNAGSLHRMMRGITMEHLLQAAVALAVMGAIGVGGSVAAWSANDFGPIPDGHMLRILALSVTAITVSVQLALSAFLLGVMDLGSGDDARSRMARLQAAFPDPPAVGRAES